MATCGACRRHARVPSWSTFGRQNGGAGKRLVADSAHHPNGAAASCLGAHRVAVPPFVLDTIGFESSCPADDAGYGSSTWRGYGPTPRTPHTNSVIDELSYLRIELSTNSVMLLTNYVIDEFSYRCIMLSTNYVDFSYRRILLLTNSVIYDFSYRPIQLSMNSVIDEFSYR